MSREKKVASGLGVKSGCMAMGRGWGLDERESYFIMDFL
jgi:hypothetical protein